MKKTLIALAVAAALPMAAAQADSSSVTIYGQMNASMNFVNTNQTGQDRLNQVASNNSRIGFKGTEDLGNGMSAVWQIEEQLNTDATSGFGGTQRNTFVGLSGKTWGTVLLGAHDTPYKLSTGKLDVFGDTMGDYRTIIGNVQGTSRFAARAGNVLAYVSPSMSGFTVAAAWVAANEAGNAGTSNPSAYSLAGMYENGPLFGALAYEKYTNGANAVSTGDVSGTKLGVGYSFGDAKIGFIWENLNDSVASSNADRAAFGLNVAYKMGANTLKAAYLRANDGADSTTDTKATNWTIGVDHNMSKRTMVYALYTKTTNNANATYGLGTSGGTNAYAATAAGEDPSAVSIGIKHSF